MGNRLLQEIARNLGNACRDYDQVGRLGGDEFVFVLPNMDKKEVADLKTRLELAVEEAGRSVCHSKVVTVSIGSAFYPQDGVTAEELLSEADRRMYETKGIYYKQLSEVTRLDNVTSR